MKKFIIVLFLFQFISIAVIKAQTGAWVQVGVGSNALNSPSVVSQLATDSYGNIYAATNSGDPTYNGGIYSYVYKWNGTSWTKLGTGFNNSIASVVFDNISGNIYAAGFFQDTNHKFYVAKWDGTSWSNLGMLNSPYPINEITTDNLGNVYAVGWLKNSSGNAYVAKWNGTNWSQLGNLNNVNTNYSSPTINDIITDNYGNLYISATINGINYNLYQWNGTNWVIMGTGNNILNATLSTTNNLIIDNNGELVCDGYFSDSSTILSPARYNGTAWNQIPPPGENLTPPICKDNSGNLYATGYYGSVYKWSGSSWSNYAGMVKFGLSNPLNSMITDKSETIYATGFGTNNGKYYYVAKWDPNAVPFPSVNAVTYCQNATATSLTAIGTNLQWYDAEAGGNLLTSAPIPNTSDTGSTTYYVSQTINGVESQRASVVVTVNPNPVAPTVISPVIYCQNATASALTDKPSTGGVLNWYTVSTGGTASSTAPIPSTAATDTTNYYVSQSISGCESPRASVVVTVNPNPIAPTVISPVIYCQNNTATTLTAKPSTGGTLNWYTLSTGGIASSTAPIPSTAAKDTTNYYVSQSISGCESPRATITVAIHNPPTNSNAGTNQYINYTATNLYGNIPAVGSGAWSVVSGTGAFANDTSAITYVTGLGQGLNVLKWTISYGSCPSSSSTVTINTGNAPTSQTINGPINVIRSYLPINYTYSVPATIGITKKWTVPTGATIVSYNSDSSLITVDFGTTSGNVSVSETNLWGSITSSLFVTVFGPPVQQNITGAVYIASNSSATYSITTPSGVTNHWNIPAGSSITSSNSDSSQVIILFGTSGGIISATQSNSFGSSVNSEYINVGNAPVTQTISGPAYIAAGSTGVTYSVADNSGASYHWTLPPGATITSANPDSSQITVSFGTTGGALSVTEANLYGKATSSTTVVISSTTGVITITNQDSYELYPNPFSSSATLIVNSTEKLPLTINIVDLNGEAIYSSSAYRTNEDITLGNEITASGIYFVQVSYGNEFKILKLVRL